MQACGTEWFNGGQRRSLFFGHQGPQRSNVQQHGSFKATARNTATDQRDIEFNARRGVKRHRRIVEKPTDHPKFTSQSKTNDGGHVQGKMACGGHGSKKYPNENHCVLCVCVCHQYGWCVDLASEQGTGRARGTTKCDGHTCAVTAIDATY